MSGEIFTKEKRAELRAEYCLNNGYSHFNSNVLNEYTDYLELRLIQSEANEAKEPASNCTMNGVSGCFWCDNPLVVGQVLEVLPDNRGIAHKKCAEEFYGSKIAED